MRFWRRRKMWAIELCVVCLSWLYGVFVRPLINFSERFWPGSFRSASEVAMNTAMNTVMNTAMKIAMNTAMKIAITIKITVTKYAMYFITMHKCTELYEDSDVHILRPLRTECERRTELRLKHDSEATSSLGSRLVEYHVELFSRNVMLSNSARLHWRQSVLLDTS